MQSFKRFSCDICGSRDAEEIPEVRQYNADQAVHVCRECGFVYVRDRRSAAAIADTWTNEMYQHDYTARIPAVRARHRYVADMLDNAAALKGKSVVDIGAGEGYFLELLAGSEYGAKVFGIEPSEANCRRMTERGVENFFGTIEDYMTDNGGERSFDVAVIVWTLENCQDCVGMVKAAHRLLRPGGQLLVSTGSRILVPFKKPLHYYFGQEPADAHPFRFSANSCRNLFALGGFQVSDINRYIDSEYLVVIGERLAEVGAFTLLRDDCAAVRDFFTRWDLETQQYYRDS